MKLSTKRCLIRPFTEADIHSFMVYHNDLQWMKYQGFKGLSQEEYRQLLLPVSYTEGKQLAIVHNKTQELIGDLYLKQENDSFWLGYSIAPSFSRQGYAFEVIQVIITFLKTTDCQKVKASILPENLASSKLLKKLGFSTVLTTKDEQLYILTL